MAQTQVILLQRVENLGQMGDVVTVKPGFARNFLLPTRKALRASKDNLAYFEGQKKQLEAVNLQKRGEAEKVAAKAQDLMVTIIRQAAEGGQLYGSVTARDIADAITAAGFTVARDQVRLNQAYKTIGLFPVSVALHPEVVISVTINIARSDEEAKVQKKTGKAMIATAGGNAPAETAEPAKAAFLEEGALAAEAAAAESSQAEAAEAAEKSAKRAAKKSAKQADESPADAEQAAE